MMFYYTSKEHLERIFKKFNEYRNKKKFLDVKLFVPEVFGSTKLKEYDCHKIILASQSSYFKSGFTTALNSGSSHDCCELRGISDEGFSSILNFMYSTTLLYDASIIYWLLQIADYLDIRLARKCYSEFILKYDIPLNQAINLIDICSTTSSKPLEEKCMNQILRNFVTCLNLYKNEFLFLSTDQFGKILRSDSNEASEVQLLELLLCYMEKNSSILDEHQQTNLLQALRYPSIKKEDFDQIKKSHPVAASMASFKSFETAFEKFINNSASQIEAYLTRPREGCYYYLAFIDKTDNDKIFIYDIHQNSFFHFSEYGDDSDLQMLYETLSRIPITYRHFFSLEMNNGNLSCIVSHPVDMSRLPSFFRYENQMWHDQFRTQIALDAFIHQGYFVYNIGGFDPQRCTALKGAAIYGRGPWQLIPSMSVSRCEHALVLSDGVVYAIGGMNEEVVYNKAEYIMIEPLGEGWNSIAPMLHKRQGHKAVAFNNKIYVFGGYKSPHNTESKDLLVNVNEVYDIRTNCWEEFSAPASEVHYIAVNVVHGIFYVLVSIDAKTSYMQLKMFTFDPKTIKWNEKLRYDLPQPCKFDYSTKFSKSDILKI